MRTAVLWLLVLALLGGTVELHSDAAGHGIGNRALAGAHAGEAVYLCAEDHAPGAHVEQARTVDRHDCAACLHRLQVPGGDTSDFVLHGEGGPGVAPPVERSSAIRAPVLERSPSRGPPVA